MNRETAIRAFLTDDTARRRETGGGCNYYWGRPDGPFIKRVLDHLNGTTGSRAPLAGGNLVASDNQPAIDLDERAIHETNRAAVASAERRRLGEKKAAMMRALYAAEDPKHAWHGP